jgi:hypothetical protein
MIVGILQEKAKSAPVTSLFQVGSGEQNWEEEIFEPQRASYN